MHPFRRPANAYAWMFRVLNYPRFDRNPNSDVEPAEATAADLRRARQTVLIMIRLAFLDRPDGGPMTDSHPPAVPCHPPTRASC